MLLQLFMPVHKFFGFGIYFTAIATMLMGLMEFTPLDPRSANQHYMDAIAICIVTTAIFTVMTVGPMPCCHSCSLLYSSSNLPRSKPVRSVLIFIAV
jgi:hypothetical protein